MDGPDEIIHQSMRLRIAATLNALPHGQDRRTVVEDIWSKELIQRFAVDGQNTLCGAWSSSGGHGNGRLRWDTMPR